MPLSQGFWSQRALGCRPCPFPTAGAGIIYQSLSQPITKLITNAKANAQWAVGEIEDNSNPNYGFNVSTMEFGDLVKMGVLDPAKVVRTALQNAASAAAMLLTTEVAITDIPEDKKDKCSHAPSDMDGMY